MFELTNVHNDETDPAQVLSVRVVDARLFVVSSSLSSTSSKFSDCSFVVPSLLSMDSRRL